MSTAFAVPAPSSGLDDAIHDLRLGRPVLAVDDLGGTGIDVILLARHATVQNVAMMIRIGSGFLCVTVDQRTAVRLQLPPMTWEPGAPGFGGRMCVSVDAVAGTTTGISAGDRAVTLRALAEPSARPEGLSRPGHVIPVLVDHSCSSPDRTAVLARAGVLCAEDGDGVEPVAFTSLVSHNDPRAIASSDEAADLNRPVIRYSDLVGQVPAGIESASTVRSLR